MGSKKICAIDSHFSAASNLNKYMGSIFCIVKASYAVAPLQTDINDWTFIRCSYTLQQKNSWNCGTYVNCNVYAAVDQFPLSDIGTALKSREWVKHLISKGFKEKLRYKKRQTFKSKKNEKCTLKISNLHLDVNELPFLFCTCNQQVFKIWSICNASDCPGNKKAISRFFAPLVENGFTNHVCRVK